MTIWNNMVKETTNSESKLHWWPNYVILQMVLPVCVCMHFCTAWPLSFIVLGWVLPACRYGANSNSTDGMNNVISLTLAWNLAIWLWIYLQFFVHKLWFYQTRQFPPGALSVTLRLWSVWIFTQTFAFEKINSLPWWRKYENIWTFQ